MLELRNRLHFTVFFFAKSRVIVGYFLHTMALVLPEICSLRMLNRSRFRFGTGDLVVIFNMSWCIHGFFTLPRLLLRFSLFSLSLLYLLSWSWHNFLSFGSLLLFPLALGSYSLILFGRWWLLLLDRRLLSFSLPPSVRFLPVTQLGYLFSWRNLRGLSCSCGILSSRVGP